MKEQLEQRLVELIKTEASQMAQINQLDSLLGQARAVLNMIQGRKAELNELIALSTVVPSTPPEDIELPDFGDAE